MPWTVVVVDLRIVSLPDGRTSALPSFSRRPARRQTVRAVELSRRAPLFAPYGRSDCARPRRERQLAAAFVHAFSIYWASERVDKHVRTRRR
jgi:hypothetical protein